VAQQVRAEQFEQERLVVGPGLAAEGGEALAQRVERPLGVPRLGDAVGVEQELVVRLEGQGAPGAGAVPQPEQPERRRGGGDLQDGHGVP
jgi:hypothetical protein